MCVCVCVCVGWGSINLHSSTIDMSIYNIYFGDAGPEQNLVLFVSKLIKKNFRNAIRASNSLDQNRDLFVRPDMNPIFLQMLSTEDTSIKSVDCH